jgi:signal transduction histidine kinase
LQICDTGSGILPEIQEKIFHPFFSSKPKGSGLGLAISQKIIQAHQADILIESELQKGAWGPIFLRKISQYPDPKKYHQKMAIGSRRCSV